MGPDQEANWCVTRPWMDHVMGTRKPYVGTPAEARDQARRARVAEARRAALAAAADLPSAAATGASAHALDESRTSA
jgi:hypothetical protein